MRTLQAHKNYCDLRRLFHPYYLIRRNADDHRDKHVRKGVSEDEIDIHQVAVNNKADDPDYEVRPDEGFFDAAALKDEEIGNEDCRHRCENRADEV